YSKNSLVFAYRTEVKDCLPAGDSVLARNGAFPLCFRRRFGAIIRPQRAGGLIMHRIHALSRRALLQGTGAVALVTSMRDARAAAPGSIITMLSTYMAEAANRKLPDAVVEKSKQMILDTLAAMISGSQLPPGKIALAFARGSQGEKTATIAASNLLCGPIEAALVNGMLAHSD